MTIKVKYIIFSTVYLTILRSSEIRSQNVQSPCPNVFQYRYNQQTGIFGEIRIKAGATNYLHLTVQMSIGNAIQGYNGKLELLNPKQAPTTIANGEPLVYYLYFPVWQNNPPKITQILVNGNLICSGPKVPANTAPIISTVNLTHKLTIDGLPLSVSNAPPENNFIPVKDMSNEFSGQPPDTNFYHYFSGMPNNAYRPTYEFYEFDEYGRPKPISNPEKNKFNFNPTPPPNKHNFQPKPPKDGASDVYKGNPFFTTNNKGNNGNNGNTGNTGNIHAFNPTVSRPMQPIRPTTPPPAATASIDFPEDFDVVSKDSVKPNRPLSEVCGISVETNNLIYNGQPVAKGAHPWLVAVFQVTISSLSYICSSTLISHRHVVTAAHCLIHRDTHTRLKAQDVILILGKLNIHKWIPVGGEKLVEPESLHIHPDYKTDGDADIAVMILSESIEFTRYIIPACLWRGDTDLEYIVGHSGTVVGWGKDEKGNLVTEKPQQISLPVVSQERCRGSNPEFHYITSNRTFCAGYRNGTGPCNGDSGGGFLMKWDGRWMLRGVVSLSISKAGNCDLTNYVVFTDASKFLYWLSTFFQ